MSEVADWTITLLGHKFDLQELPRWTAGADITVVPDGESYALRIPASLMAATCDEARSLASAWLERMNGIGRLLDAGFRPLALSSSTDGRDSTGKVISRSFAVEGATLRLKGQLLVGSINGTFLPDPDRGAAVPMLRAAALSDRAHDALVILGRPSLTWAELYLVFELVEGDVGGKMFDFGWITKPAADLFGHTANSYSTLRSGGRHGKDRGRPPANPMSHADALTEIRQLVCHWLEYLASQSSLGPQ